jgi:hypothetical protein
VALSLGVHSEIRPRSKTKNAPREELDKWKYVVVSPLSVEDTDGVRHTAYTYNTTRQPGPAAPSTFAPARERATRNPSSGRADTGRSCAVLCISGARKRHPSDRRGRVGRTSQDACSTGEEGWPRAALALAFPPGSPLHGSEDR